VVFVVFFVLKHRPGEHFTQNTEIRIAICKHADVVSIVPGTKRAINATFATEIKHTAF
jgi:hypothetical protein